MPTTSKKKKKSRKAKKRMRMIRRYTAVLSCILLVVILLTGMTTGWFSNNDVMDVESSSVKDDGLLRVYLKSLNRPIALGMTLDGVFSVDGDAGFRFQRGSEITVACDNGDLLLTCGGMTIDMGSSFTLKRHLPSDGNDTCGIFIHESEKDALFAGDLKLTNENGGIDAILTIQIEDYLLGVVAYEMSNSFPLEALKAQAVAARTYAINAKASAKNRAYDVVDTTQDQVYKGYDPAFTKVEEAVKATEGIVGFANGRYANCYYTASNGGQVATPKQIWGGSGGEYIVMKDDPYDLENPESVVKRAFIPYAPGEGSEIALALSGAISEEVASLGMSDDGKDIRIDRIHSIKLADPDREGSRMYGSMIFEFEASGREIIFTEEATAAEATLSEPANSTADRAPVGWAAELPDASYPLATTSEATPEEPSYTLSEYKKIDKTFTVTLKTYGQAENLLSLSINSTNIEIFDIEETETGFTVSSRRFGHGSGMSQRGAQQMAGKYEKKCMEILEFYYPGADFEKISWQTPALTAIEALPDSVGAARAKPTPRPTQIPLPPLTGNEYYAVVTLETASSSLNVRKDPNTSAPVMGTLSNKDRVIVIEPTADGWFKIKTVELSGFVKGDYIVKE